MVTNDSCIFLKVSNITDELWIKSINKGDTWEKRNIAFNETLSASGNMVFKTHTGNKVVFYNDYGDTWNTIDSCIWGAVSSSQPSKC